MTTSRNSAIDAYIDRLPKWQHDICTKLRDLIHEAEPEIEETIKRGDRPYFILNGTVCAFQATKDHVNLFIYDPIAPDPHNIINQGQGNATARSVQIYQDDPINKGAIKTLVGAVVSNNRAGGWRKLKRYL
ncbi:DUF1801 domain-containing protein [Patescibacteria group bacterium]|nr:MAG: DUF1801 domain-containing protein [Patescibacteria group bacterium]